MFYKRTSSKNPYLQATPIVGEPDIRAELKMILQEERKGTEVIYRRARRDENRNPVLCECRKNNRNNEADSYGCRVCKGMGYLFDDYPLFGYLNSSQTEEDRGRIRSFGNKETQSEVIYLEYDCIFRYTNNRLDLPDKYDMIWLPLKDIEGKIISPLRPETMYNVQVVDPFKLDSNGRIEYYKITLTSHYRQNSKQ